MPAFDMMGASNAAPVQPPAQPAAQPNPNNFASIPEDDFANMYLGGNDAPEKGFDGFDFGDS